MSQANDHHITTGFSRCTGLPLLDPGAATTSGLAAIYDGLFACKDALNGAYNQPRASSGNAEVFLESLSCYIDDLMDRVVQIVEYRVGALSDGDTRIEILVRDAARCGDWDRVAELAATRTAKATH